MQSLNRSATLAQIVTEHPAAARVFQSHGMDFCCHGNVSVSEACEGGPLDPEVVFAELEGAIGAARAAAGDDPRELSRAALVARVVERYHGYARRSLPHIAALLAKVVAAHGARQTSLHELQATFHELEDALLPHLDEEESVLFPAIVASRSDTVLVRRELDRMAGEHLAVGKLLARTRVLTNRFSTPEWACATYRILMSELEALELDTLRHVHLENYVLAPLASRAA